MNPYSQANFLEFILIFLKRLLLFILGKVPLSNLASDEIQLIVMIGIGATSAMVGCFLILRKMTMLANAISHTILLGIFLATFFLYEIFSNNNRNELISIETLMVASIVMAIATAFLTEFLTKRVRFPEDASTGFVFITLFALGVMLVTLFSRDLHLGTEAIMGNVDALHLDDLFSALFVFVFNLVLIFAFFKEYQITTFDPSFALSQGISPLFFNYLLLAQFAITAVVSFRAVGVIMVLSLLTGPPLIARLLTHDLKKMILLSILMGSLISFVGVALSRHILTVTGEPLSTGGLTVSLIAILYLSIILIKLIILRFGRFERHVESGVERP